MKKPWPVPVPLAFWVWARWWLSGERRRGIPRPKAVDQWLRRNGRRTIPLSWQIHREAIRSKPRPRVSRPSPALRDLGLLGTGNGYVVTAPGGDAEIAPDAYVNGFRLLLINVSPEINLAEYDALREQAERTGMIYGPWAYVRSLDGLHRVETIADEWARESPFARLVGHDIENPEMTSTVRPPTVPSAFTSGKKIRICMPEGWAGDASLRWDLAGFDVVTPQCFMNVHRRLIPKVCVDHAVDLFRVPGLPIFGRGLWREAEVLPAAEWQPLIQPAEYLSLWPGPFWVYSGNGMNPSDWRRR